MSSTVGVSVTQIKIDGPCYRAMSSKPTAMDDGVLVFPFSSPLPGRQYFGTEILSHEAGAINFERMNDGSAPHLWNHDRDIVLGINQRGWLENGRGYSQVLFDLEDEESRKKYERIKRGFLPNVSTFYDINDWEEMFNDETQEPYVLVRSWTPLETSTVSIPVDHTVGAGRSESIIWTPSQSQLKINSNEAENKREMTTATEDIKNESTAAPALTDHDLQAAREAASIEAKNAERERLSGLRALQKNYGNRHPSIATKIEEAMDAGWTVEAARTAITDIILGDSESRPPVTGAPRGILNSEEEKQEYSLFRAVLAAVQAKTPAEARRMAPFEYEVSEEIAKQLKRGTAGLYIPIADLSFNPREAQRGHQLLTGSRASYTVGSAATAGNLVDNEFRPEMLLEYLFNRPVVSRMGATRFSGLRGDFEFPVEDAASLGITWLGEDDPTTEQDTSFSLKGMSPKTAGAYMRVTDKMLKQSEIAMEPYMRSRLGIAMMLGVDNAALYGTGVGNQPRGILNYPGINNVALGTNGGAPSWSSIVQMETLINAANADVGQMGYVTNSRAKGTLKVTPKVPDNVQAGSFVTGEFLWSSNGDTDTLNGYRAMCSNQLPSNLTKGTGTDLSAMIFGVWSQLMIGQWGVLEIMTNPYGNDDFIRGAVKVRSLFSMDVQVGYERSFSAITDMITQ